jgi:hypothetical protein
MKNIKQSPEYVEQLLSDILCYIEKSNLPLEAGVEIDFREIYTDIHPKGTKLGAIDNAWQYYEYLHPLRDINGFWQSTYRITEKGVEILKEIKRTKDKSGIVRLLDSEKQKRGIMWGALFSFIILILALLPLLC